MAIDDESRFGEFRKPFGQGGVLVFNPTRDRGKGSRHEKYVHKEKKNPCFQEVLLSFVLLFFEEIDHVFRQATVRLDHIGDKCENEALEPDDKGGK